MSDGIKLVPLDILEPGEWHLVSTRYDGSRLMASVDGGPWIDVEDAIDRSAQARGPDKE